MGQHSQGSTGGGHAATETLVCAFAAGSFAIFRVARKGNILLSGGGVEPDLSNSIG
jgi:hypothetical protein